MAQKQRLIELDILRVWAILLIVLAHVPGYAPNLEIGRFGIYLVTAGLSIFMFVSGYGLRLSDDRLAGFGDVEDIRRHCDDLGLEFHMLFAMMSFPAFYLGLLGVGRLVFRVGCQIDRWLFTVIPPSRWLAWSVTLVGRIRSQSNGT